jgi:nicotinic acid mononucleotide adenylyltransferase
MPQEVRTTDDIALDRIEAELRALRQLVEGLDPSGPPRLAFVWRAPRGIRHPGQRLGVLSGSFNPLTRGHTRLVELAAEQCDLDEVALELAVANVDKQAAADELAKRLWVLRHYASQRTDLSVMACSHGRFIDKVQALERAYPADTALLFIVGFDTLVRVFDPRYYTDPQAELAELFARSQFIVANRDPVTPTDIRHWLEDPARRRYADRIHIVELDGFHARISGTQVRASLAAGQPIDHLVPQEVVSAVETLWHTQRTPRVTGV